MKACPLNRFKHFFPPQIARFQPCSDILVYRQILFKTQKHFWLSLKLNYAVCVAGIRSSALSKPVTYSWNKFRFFKDIIFHISQRCLHIPVVLVLDILRTLNKLHSAGSETSFSGKHGSSAIRNNLLVEYWTVMKLWEFVLTLDAYFDTPLNINERFGFKLSLHNRGLEEIASIKVNISIIFWGRLKFYKIT